MAGLRGIAIRTSNMPSRFGRAEENDAVEGQWRAPYAYGQSPFGDHAKSVVQLQKRAFLDDPAQGNMNMLLQADPMQPYAMGMDKETFNRVVVMPSTFMGLVLALLVTTMFTRWKQGKPVTPWDNCPPGYTGAPGGAGGGPGGRGAFAASDGDGGSGMGASVAGYGTGAGSGAGGGGAGGGMGPGGVSAAGGGGPTAVAGPGASAAGAPGAAKKEKKEELPYERIPTPGVTPYIWSPPATIFQPSPTPPGTPFVGSPSGGAGADDMDDDMDDEYVKGARSPKSSS